MSTVNAPLKYLFVAEYKDGTYFAQTPEDKSVTGEGSAFTDVDQKKLIRFHLIQPTAEGAAPGNQYTVDLRDGHFEVNGIPFQAQGQYEEVENPKLVFFRETRRDTTVTATVQKDKSVTTESQEVWYYNRYFIGWETRGKNKVQRMIGIS